MFPSCLHGYTCLSSETVVLLIRATECGISETSRAPGEELFSLSGTLLLNWSHLRALIIVEAETALRVQAIGPEAINLEMSLRHLAVGKQEPGAEDWLGEDIEDSVGDDLLVDTENASTVGDAPDDWVDEPDDDGVGRDGAVELAKVGAFSTGLSTAIEDEVPDHDKERNACDCVPAPALWVVL